MMDDPVKDDSVNDGAPTHDSVNDRPAIDRAVIIAGGGGTRLWPWAGPGRPKPLLPLGGGGRTLLSATLDRLEGLVPQGEVRIQASPSLGVVLVASDRRLGPGALGSEPSPRDTAPAIALAMRRILDDDPEAVTVILPADHRIAEVPVFQAALRRAGEAARAGYLVTLGIEPDRPSTDFGYIECSGEIDAVAGVRSVARFVEKPDEEKARGFLEAGNYFWNGGIFIWKASEFWNALEEHAPEVAGPVSRFHETGAGAAWEEAKKTSIDYALMERAKRVVSVPLDAGWNDIGGWEAVAELARAGDAGPVRLSRICGSCAEDSIALVVGGDEHEAGEDGPESVVLVGDEPVLIVRGPGGTLVTPRARIGEMKPYVPH